MYVDGRATGIRTRARTTRSSVISTETEHCLTRERERNVIPGHIRGTHARTHTYTHIHTWRADGKTSRNHTSETARRNTCIHTRARARAFSPFSLASSFSFSSSLFLFLFFFFNLHRYPLHSVRSRVFFSIVYDAARTLKGLHADSRKTCIHMYLGIVIHLVLQLCVVMAFSSSSRPADFFSFLTKLLTAFSLHLSSLSAFFQPSSRLTIGGLKLGNIEVIICAETSARDPHRGRSDECRRGTRRWVSYY